MSQCYCSECYVEDQELIQLIIDDKYLEVWDTRNLPGIYRQNGWTVPDPSTEVYFEYSWDSGIRKWSDITTYRSICTIGKTKKSRVPNSCGL